MPLHIEYDPIQFRQSTLAEEGALQVSKALKIPVLLDVDEMEDLFQTFEREVGSFGIYYAHGICKKGEGKITQSSFLDAYRGYVSSLKKGEVPSEHNYRPLFSSFLSVTPDILYAIPVEGEFQLIKATRPILQMQLNHIHYSKEDQTFRSMVFGSDSITWGIQFSYPQLFQDPKTQDIHPVREDPFFPNTALFKTFQKWNRSASMPTPFVVENKKMQVPIRLGRKCLSWIKHHPHLCQKEIYVFESTSV